MKKILFIAPHLSTGGMPQYLVKQIESIKDEMDVYCVEWGDVTGGVLVVQRNKMVKLLGNKLITLGENKHELFDVINKINPDIIHLQEIPELFMERDVADKLYDTNRTYVLIETSHDSGYDPNQNKTYLPDKFLMVSRYQANLYKDIDVPCDVVEYPIENKIRTKTREQALRDLGLDPNLKHVINVGLFTPRKNQAEVVEYARMLQNYPIQFHFIGNQADNFKFYWEPLMQNFPSNCKWWNERSDVDAFYEAADLFLFTSRGTGTDHETMPLVIREALSWKTPSMIYNLPVYMGYFDKYDTIEYLGKDTQQNAYRIVEKLLRSNVSEDNQFVYKFNRITYSDHTRIAIIVLFDDNYKELADVALPNIKSYAKLHGYDVIYFYDKIDNSRPPQWSKINAIQYVLKNYNYDWVWMTDVDAIIMNDSIKIEDIIDENYDIIMTSNKIATVTNGSSFYKNTKLTKDFLDECYTLNRDILKHIDVNAFDWDLQPIRQLYRHVPEYRERIKLVHERVCNSFWYTSDETVLSGFPDWNEWDSMYQPGDFLVNFCGRHKEERIKLMKEFVGKKGTKIYYTMNGEEKLEELSYFNSTMENLVNYGDAAAQYYANFYLKELEQNNIIIKENDVFVDLGANIGMSAIYANSKNVAEIHCFEPDPNMISLIQKNVPSAKIYPYAITDKETELELYHWPFNPVNEGPKYRCKGITLKQVLQLVGKKIDYLKIDIEGFETTVFDDMTTEDCANIDRLMIEYHKEYGVNEFCDKLRNRGFEIDYVGTGYQSYIYAKYTGNVMKKHFEFNSRWDLNEQTIYYSTQQTIDFPVIITLREYKSDAVLWSCEYDSLAPGGEYWMMPVAKHWHNYSEDPNFMGVKFCIYRKDTEEQIYEMPFTHKFVNLPTVTLSNTIPYGVNYVEFYINHKYDHWLAKPHGLTVDVGANVGVFTKYMLDRGFTRNSVMIECDVKALKDLNRYFRNNPVVTIIPKALHYSTDPVIFYHSPENPVISSTLSPDQLKNHMAGVKGNIEHKVETITIKDLTDRYGIIDLLKIDVEGAEYEIINRAEDSVFNNIRTLMIECHFFEDDAPEKYTKLTNKLKRLGYTIEEFMENQVNTTMGTSENIYAYRK